MGCARLDSLTGFVGGLTQVFNPKNVTPILGTNNHALDQPYDWDGVSDLVVDFCFNGSTSGTINNKNVYTTTSYRSIWFTADNTSTQCGNTGTQPTTSFTFYFQRPNIRFNVCLPSLDNANIAWTPNSGPNAPTPLNNDTVVATPVSPTRYTAAVTNQAGCVGNSFVFVNVDTSLRLDVRPDTFICSITPVQLRANMTGSPLPGQQFTYTWTASVGAAPPSGVGTGFANPIVNPTVPTVYTCVVTGGACLQRDTAFVIVGTGLPVGVNVDSIRCFGQATGKIRAVPLGGSPPLTYVWSPSLSSTDSIVNLGPNTYSVTVTDNLGCSGSATATLFQPPLLTLVLDSTNITCNNASNGQLNATVAGGTPAYTYTWSPVGPNSPTRTGLSPNTYRLTVTDQKGCSVVRSRSITQPTAISTTTAGYNVSANGGSDGSAKVTATGGTLPYTYTWSPGGGSTDSIFGLTAGMYFVTVCDGNQCCVVDSVEITDPPPIILTFQKTDNVCFGDSNGTASVSAQGGVSPYTFTWSNGTVGNATNGLAAGTYFVTVGDDNGVTVRGSITITHPPLLTVSLDSVSILCFGGNNGSITANVSGGTPQYTYIWSNTAVNSNVNGNLSSGTYDLTVFDAFQCSVTATKTLNQPSLLSASLVSTIGTSCFGSSDGSATIAAVGGTPNYSYQWSVLGAPNAPTANVFPAGPHAVVVTDDNGCRDTVLFAITQPAQLQVQVAPTNANCTTSNDGSALSTVSGGTTPYQYTWDGVAGPNPRTGLASGNHTLIVEDDNGCSVTENFVVGINYTLQLSIANTPTSCNGGTNGTATVTPQNGSQTYSYAWSVPGNTATIQSSAQTVSVTVTDGVGCIASANTTISEPSAITLTTGNVPPSCNGRFDGKAWVSASGGVGNYSYAWSNSSGSDTIRNIPAGNYDVTVFDGNQCTATTSVSVFNPLSLTARFEQVGITCFDAADGSGRVIASGGTSPYSYVWSDNFIGDTRSNIAPGPYQITVSDNNNCDTVLNVSFDAPPGIQFALISIDSISCPRYTDGKILIDALGGSPGVTIPYTYSLDGITFQNSRLFEDLPAGLYRVYVKDGNGCVRDTLVTIESPVELVFSIEPQDSTIGLGKSLQLDIRTNNYPLSNINAYAWSTNDGLSCADCRNPIASPYYNMDYTLSVTYGYNCLATNAVKVFVGPEPDYFMPNAFSPNGDGNNDIIMLFGASLKTVNLTIFNRWGEKVFESSNQWKGWDGTYKGQQMGPGIYTYVADLEYLNGKKKRDFGSITLIR
jgi:gliding motility-associated-like protein